VGLLVSPPPVTRKQSIGATLSCDPDERSNLMMPGYPPQQDTTASPQSTASLDIGHQNCTYSFCPRCRKAKRRRGRMFHRALSGLRLGGKMRFVTLTTSEESWAVGKNIQASFRALVMRMRRRGLCFGYVKVTEYTQAGLPHLHVILRGPYIPQWWLSEQWKEIHHSPIVDVRAVRRHMGAAAYLAKYMGKDERARYSWSWDWVWRGFALSWKLLVSVMLENGHRMVDIIAEWNYILDQFAIRRMRRAEAG